MLTPAVSIVFSRRKSTALAGYAMVVCLGLASAPARATAFGVVDTCVPTETFPPPPAAQFDRTADQFVAPAPGAPKRHGAAPPDRLELQRHADWADLCLYRAADRATAASGMPVRAVYIGDSITEYWRIANPAEFTNGIVNRGIAGQTTAQILLRFRQDVIGLRPQAVLVLAGTNDIMALGGPVTLASIEGNISSMVELAAAHGIAVVLGAVPPVGAVLNTPARQAAIKALNSWLRNYARDQVVGLADFHAVLVDGHNALNPALSIDPLHPNRRGFAAMRFVALAALRRALGN